jgi:hypothetical protein
MSCGLKSFKLVWRCHPLLSEFLANGRLPLHISDVSPDKSNNEVKLGAVHRSPGIYLTTEENTEKSLLGDCR